MTKIPEELKNAIRNNQLLIFVGAGLSYELINIGGQPIKGWSNLVEQILKHLESESYDVGDLIPLLKNYDPILVLNLIESNKNIPKIEIYNFIKDFLDLKDDNNLNLHKKLYKISNKIITTNYDTAFEMAVPELRKHKAYKGKNYELTTHKNANSNLLFKLHGCFEDADSMILFPSNYKNLYENTEKGLEHSLLVFKNIVFNKSILFIGTGMGDFQINHIFKEVERTQGEHNQKHFLISTKPLDSSLSFLTHIPVTKHSEIESFIDRLILVKEECGNIESKETLILKEQLLEAQKEIDKLNRLKNISHDQNKLFEREALKYLLKGLEYHLLNEPKKAIKEYETALELKPNLHEAFNSWGNALGHLAKTKQGNESDDLFKQAFDKFKKAIGIKSDLHESFYHWGNALIGLAQKKQGKEFDGLYSQAFDKFKKAIEIKPDLHEAFNNWGNALGHLARTKQSNESDDLYNQAFDKFKKAIEIKSDLHVTFHNWGTYLGNLAQTKQGEEFDDLYNQAFDKFKKAIEIKSDLYDTFNNWGTYLGNLAHTKQGEESDDLFDQAFEKLKKAIEIKPDLHEAFYNWGNTLGDLAKKKQGKESDDLFNQAIDKFKKAIEHGGSCYHLSCLYALKKEKESALKYLKISLLKNEIDIDLIEKGDDWSYYLKDSEFIQLLNRYRK